MSPADTAEPDFIQANSNRVSLKEFFVAIMNEREKKWEQRVTFLEAQLKLMSAKSEVQLALDASEKAVLKAEAADNARFASVNEFRAQLNDQQQTFARASEVNIRFEALNAKVDAIDVKGNAALLTLKSAEGRQAGLGVAGSLAIAGITLLLSAIAIVVTLVIKH